MSMEKGSPSLTGEVFFTDARLVANGFQIKLSPGSTYNSEGMNEALAPVVGGFASLGMGV